VNGYLTSTDWTTFNGKQATLVSGTNIKTIHTNSILGSGNLTISGTPSGSDTQVQYNSSGAFAGSANLTFDGTNLTTGGVNTPNTFGFKNRIINGNMVIDQRNNGSSVSVSGNDIFTLDRYKGWANGGGIFSVQQSSTAPINFTKSALLTVTTADSSISAGDNYRWAQAIEGYNVADFSFGTANAKTITVSFWVRSNLTGTYGGSIYSATASRSYVYQYTINSANTWEQKTVTIAGDTTGSWNTTNGNGMVVYFDLGSGSNYQNATGSWVSGEKFSTSGNASWIGTLSNNLYISGIQVETGTKATSFDVRDYGRELNLCQRYYELLFQFTAKATTTDAAEGTIGITVTKRTTPTMLIVNGTNTLLDLGIAVRSFSTVGGAFGVNGGYCILGGIGTATVGNIFVMYNAAALAASAEL
jgi:hypothetical protein